MAKSASWILVSGAALVSACASIVGADFDDRHEGKSAGGASAQGGTAASSGGSSSGGGAQAGGSNGGAKATGGTSNGGAAGAAGAAGSPAGGRVGSGGSGGLVGAGGSLVIGGSGGETPGGAGGVAGEGGVGGGSEGGTGGTASGGTASGGTASGGTASGGTGGMAIVVLNEVKAQGSGDDYIELYNRGTATAELEGYGLSDENNTFVFPAGATLAPKEFVLLLLGQTAVGGTYTCFTPRPCYHATWGVSQNGESVFFRGRQNQVLETVMYPDQNGANGISNDQTWGRYPDGTGSFLATRRTPEAPNMLPQP